MENMEVKAHLYNEDGTWFVADIVDGEREEPKACQISKDGLCIVLPENAANRKYFMLAKAEKETADADHIELTYKATRQIGSTGPKMPNAKLVEYLKGYKGTDEEPVDGDALYEEYVAIVARATEAYQASKNQPKSEKEKLEAKLAAAKAKYEKLLAEAAASDAE